MAGEMWLRCTCCQCRLARVEQKDGRTYIPISIFGMVVLIDRATITCPNCGGERRFVGVRVISEQLKFVDLEQ